MWQSDPCASIPLPECHNGQPPPLSQDSLLQLRFHLRNLFTTPLPLWDLEVSVAKEA